MNEKEKIAIYVGVGIGLGLAYAFAPVLLPATASSAVRAGIMGLLA